MTNRPNPAVNMPEPEMHRRVALVIAFTQYHENGGVLPPMVADRRPDAIAALVNEGLLIPHMDGYQITTQGIAEWKRIVTDYYTNITATRKNESIYGYNDDGTRKDKES